MDMRKHHPSKSKRRFRVAVISPSTDRYDATLHYYQADFSGTVRHLRETSPGVQVEALAAGICAAPRRIVAEAILKEPDVAILWCRVWEASAVLRTAAEIRRLSPCTRILVWGDAVHWMPHFFQREPFDGLVASGDPEAVLSDALAAFQSGRLVVPGLAMRESGWRAPCSGRFLNPSKWPFPDLGVIDFADYRQAREFRGKPTDDLSFYVSRGCAMGCEWCSAPLKEGKRDRRRPVEQTVDYMRNGLGQFSLYQMHSPMFMQDRHWCEEFAGEMRRQGLYIPFKIVTLQRHLEDEALVADLASVGLQSAGFGIETLTADKSRCRIAGKVNEERLASVSSILKQNEVQGKAYIQIGLPGQRREDVLYTVDKLRSLGFALRPTGATPFQRLRGIPVEELDRMDLTQWDRKSYFDPACGLSYAEFHRLIIHPERFQPEAESSTVEQEEMTCVA